MLLLHEVHTVAGLHEEAFEAQFRDGWMPMLAKSDDPRLLDYLKLAHGTARASLHAPTPPLPDARACETVPRRGRRRDLRPRAAGAQPRRPGPRGQPPLPVRS